MTASAPTLVSSEGCNWKKNVLVLFPEEKSGLFFLPSSLTELWGTSQVKRAELVVLWAFCSNICTGNTAWCISKIFYVFGISCNPLWIKIILPVNLMAVQPLNLWWSLQDTVLSCINHLNHVHFWSLLQLHFFPKQSSVSVGIKMYKMVLWELLSPRNLPPLTQWRSPSLYLFASREYYWNHCRIFPCCQRGFHGLVGCLQ